MWTSAIDRPGVMEIVDSTKKKQEENSLCSSVRVTFSIACPSDLVEAERITKI